MRYRSLGNTGIKVSEVSLGCMELGRPNSTDLEQYRWLPSEQQAIALIHRALDLGVNFLDTARIYGDSERLVGLALRGRRDRCYLATKVQAQGSTEQEARANARASVETSLRILQTDHVDLLQLHSGTVQDVERGWVYEELTQMRQEGKARHIGITVATYDCDAALAAIMHGGYQTIQPSFNLFYREPAERLFDLAASKGIGILAKMPLWQGMPEAYGQLSDQQRSAYPLQRDQFFERVTRFDQLCQQRGWDRYEVMLAFVLSFPQVSAAIPGTRQIGHLEKNVAVSGKEVLSESDLAFLRQEL